MGLPDGSELSVNIESAWRHQDLWVLKFAGIDSIDAAERFRGTELRVPATDRGKLPDGEYFQSDLIGCALIDKVSGHALGTVVGWQENGGPLLMEVARDGREVLIPFVTAICQEVDVAARKIVVDVPEGLLDL